MTQPETKRAWREGRPELADEIVFQVKTLVKDQIRTLSCCRFSIFVFVLQVTLTVAAGPGWAQPIANQQFGHPVLNGQGFESWLERFLADQFKGSDPPELALVVVKHDTIIYQTGLGASDALAGGDPPDQSLFRAASVSKLITATAVMQLFDQGKLDLDRDVNEYLSFRLPDTFSEPVTVRHLLMHTSGIEDRLFGNSAPAAAQPCSLGEYFSANVPQRSRPPGQMIIYSNTGMALAGHLVETISGMSFTEYVERNIFEPLRMDHSSFRQPYPAELAPHVVPSGADDSLLLLFPSGSMVSPVADMGNFMIAHLNDGRFGDVSILSPPTIATMHEHQFAAHSRMPGMALGFMENETNDHRILFHTGASGHQSLLCLIPEKQVGFYLVLSSQQGGPLQTLRATF
jgi:CubicO group peptidase (beta-lactamase class C family)